VNTHKLCCLCVPFILTEAAAGHSCRSRNCQDAWRKHQDPQVWIPLHTTGTSSQGSCSYHEK